MIDGFERAVNAAGDRAKWTRSDGRRARRRVNQPTFAHRAEYAAMRGAVAAMERLSFARAGRIGERIGRLGYAPLGIRRAVVERQLTRRVSRAARRGDRAHRARGVRASRTHERSRPRSCRRTASREIIDLFEAVHGWELVEERLARGKGLILVTGHLGNWELGGAYLAARGLPIDAVARHMANPLFDRLPHGDARSASG